MRRKHFYETPEMEVIPLDQEESQVILTSQGGDEEDDGEWGGLNG